ncbi:MAG: acetolactate synthase, small subunit [Defluviitaleaceae bacterium]|uniref:Acetolactate synthase small subunit n=1 Tax=Defluviitalea raffinosedens TaxID=1450156 RepID=A0A7C8LQ69_9FIRM|nr:acetolactate synthase small subunit [Defluviitalea raffinosedens]KAE9634525.1 acetolactate synthase small subunit [Defluviitalea raffinosedens]MBZ4668859.1 acetolactate synthase, small subunit [Defluviitaleaceae bacterium]HHW66907.1 acetolactate synthase small subunit [Candidatus Epulonipiscium sp.]
MKRYVLSVLVENHSGVLSRVSGLFSRRGYNIDSLSVGETEDPNVSRMTIVVRGDEYILEQIKKQLNKLIDVIKVIELKPEQSVYRELVLIKVGVATHQRPEVIEIVNIFRGRIVDVASESLMIEITGDEAKVSALISMLEPYGIKEMIRTGLTALERGNKEIKQHNKYEEE